MKYAVVKCSNGSYAIASEGWTDKEKAIVDFLGKAQALHNASDVISACVMIVDENLDVVDGYKESIHHAVVEPVEPTE